MSTQQQYRVRFGPTRVRLGSPTDKAARGSMQIEQGGVLPLGIDPDQLQHLISVGIAEPIEQNGDGHE